MLYVPKNEKLWDCWMYHRDGLFYLYYLRISAKGSWWDGVSLAISKDLLHWDYVGPVVEKRDVAKWMGTGMVWKQGDRYLMNFSEEAPALQQKIYFAESHDLISWHRLDGVCEPDGIHYLRDYAKSPNPYPRWDSLGVFETNVRPGMLHAFVTASVDQPEQPARNGALGFLESSDGLLWKSLPCPLEISSEYPNYEVPEYLELNGRHYALFSSNSKAGIRFENPTSAGPSGGTYYLVADAFDGPYRKPKANNRLIGQSDVDNVTMNYVGRTLRWNGKILFYHIWGNQTVDGAFGTVKELVETKPYVLRVRYLRANDGLKGRSLWNTDSMSYALWKHHAVNPPIEWRLEESSVRFRNRGGSGAWIAPLRLTRTISDGRFAVARVRVEEGIGAGLVFGDERRHYAAFLNFEAGRIEFGELVEGWEANLYLRPILKMPWKLPYGRAVTLRIIQNGCFFEVYANDDYVMGIRLETALTPTRFGLYAESADGGFSRIRVHSLR